MTHKDSSELNAIRLPLIICGLDKGPGSFRDMVQNRRNDVVINPRIGSFNVKLFLSFIQADGYNPLSVEAVAFSISNKGENS